ncbi:CpcT/CpeT family chromophore lyase [Candidatus Aalborgicola defluviihabitans]|uniref:CpcT/CpeT family chromophore lyase n=1 Tax=Candidatus Aalborgicola defluviihabitans TaxID=3386187 RepID=UPI001D24FFF7|nr:hypothetical protein [Burkholderiales bacterium]
MLTGLAYAAEPEPNGEAELLRLLDLLNGRFDNLQQMRFVAATAADAKVNHYEAMRMQGRSFSSTQLEGRWIYSQTDKIEPGDASKGKLYRQVLQQFFITDGQIYSRAWRFNDPAVKQQGTPSDDFLLQLSPKQLSMAMSEPCLTRWAQVGEQFTGRIDPATCLLQSKYKNEKRRLFSEQIVFPSGSWFREGAYGEDNKLAFGLEEGYYVRLNRLPATKPQAD